jgi:hypothetical protein
MRHGPHRNEASNDFSNVVCVLVTTETCLPIVATVVVHTHADTQSGLFWATIPAFMRWMDTQTHRQKDDLINLLLPFQNKERKLITNINLSKFALLLSSLYLCCHSVSLIVVFTHKCIYSDSRSNFVIIFCSLVSNFFFSFSQLLFFYIFFRLHSAGLPSFSFH